MQVEQTSTKDMLDMKVCFVFNGPFSAGYFKGGVPKSRKVMLQP